MIWKTLLPTILAVLASAAVIDEDERIIGGRNAAPAEFPFIVSLQYPSGDGYVKFCGGSIIKPDWVVTAAHCVLYIEQKGLSIEVRAGVTSTYENSENSQLRKVIKQIRHPSYGGGSAPDDIALLKLEQPLKYSRYVQPIQLPVDNQKPKNRGVIIGYGRTAPQPQISLNEELKAVEVTVAGLGWCKQVYQNVTDNHICPGEKGKGSCQGDSGGPFIQNDDTGKPVLIGVSSFTQMPCGRIAAVYVLVPKYINNFILPTISAN